MAGSVEIVASIAAYSTCSISMILLNKLLMFSYKIDFPMGLLLLQNGCAFFLVFLAKRLKLISYPDLDMKIVKKWLPLTTVFVLMLWTSMKSLHLMSVALQTIIKNTAIILTAIGDWKFHGKQLTPPMFAAFGLMLLGSFLGTQGDKWWTAEGMFWTLFNVVSTVAYVLYMKQVTDTIPPEVAKGYSAVFYNNLLSLPFLIPASVWSLGDMFDVLAAAPPTVHLCVFLMVIIGSFMTFATFWCMGVTGPTTYSVTGSLNKIPLAFFGIIIFDQWPVWPMGYLGIAVGISGGCLYTYLNLKPKAPAPILPVSNDDNGNSSNNNTNNGGAGSGAGLVNNSIGGSNGGGGRSGNSPVREDAPGGGSGFTNHNAPGSSFQPNQRRVL